MAPTASLITGEGGHERVVYTSPTVFDSGTVSYSEMGPPHSGSGSPETADVLPLDTSLELLANERRRYVIASLQEAPAPIAGADLAKRIADRESRPPSQSVEDHREIVHASLYHCHLPKLADADVVSHDRDRNSVEPAANFESVSALWNDISDVLDLDSE